MNRFLKGTLASLTVLLTGLAGAANAAAEGHAAEEGSPLLRFDPGVGIWALIVFVVLLLLLKRFAWGPILDALDTREKSVRESLDQAANIQAENARLAEEQAKSLAEARAEATRIVQSAREAGDALRKSLESAAQDEKRRIIASAQQEIEAQTQAAIAQLRKTTADLSIQVAEKLLRQNLDDAKNRALVDQLIRETAPKA
ncbi:MAG TPA: F0F1 ATP synthase subunit B [Fibrobacteria bacterium]|jgi:F-type H+-transporting ATPase subunit b|nr:F0F1 ATP synthase subunit B [Fibrobacteria bacterium]